MNCIIIIANCHLTILLKKSKLDCSQKPFASIKGRTRKEIVDDAIEAIKNVAVSGQELKRW